MLKTCFCYIWAFFMPKSAGANLNVHRSCPNQEIPEVETKKIILDALRQTHVHEHAKTLKNSALYRYICAHEALKLNSCQLI